MARVLCTSKISQKERKVHHVAPKYTATLNSHKSTLSPRLFCFYTKSCKATVIKDILPLGHYNIHLLEWVQTGNWGNEEERADFKLEEATKRDGQ